MPKKNFFFYFNVFAKNGYTHFDEICPLNYTSCCTPIVTDTTNHTNTLLLLKHCSKNRITHTHLHTHSHHTTKRLMKSVKVEKKLLYHMKQKEKQKKKKLNFYQKHQRLFFFLLYFTFFFFIAWDGVISLFLFFDALICYHSSFFFLLFI